MAILPVWMQSRFTARVQMPTLRCAAVILPSVGARNTIVFGVRAFINTMVSARITVAALFCVARINLTAKAVVKLPTLLCSALLNNVASAAVSFSISAAGKIVPGDFVG